VRLSCRRSRAHLLCERIELGQPALDLGDEVAGFEARGSQRVVVGAQGDQQLFERRLSLALEAGESIAAEPGELCLERADLSIELFAFGAQGAEFLVDDFAPARFALRETLRELVGGAGDRERAQLDRADGSSGCSAAASARRNSNSLRLRASSCSASRLRLLRAMASGDSASTLGASGGDSLAGSRSM
jgi:hypothetical protein